MAGRESRQSGRRGQPDLAGAMKVEAIEGETPPPARLGRNGEARRPYEGPVEWLFPRLEQTYTRLGPKDEVEPALRRPRRQRVRGAAAKAVAEAAETIPHQERLVEGKLAGLHREYWSDLLGEYHRRRLHTVPHAEALAVLAPGMPALVGQNNWTPLGPSVVARGQTNNRAAIGGRVSGIAIAPGGQRLYVSTANGGVWRSDDGGRSWRSTMDGFDVNPSNFATTSLTCGAVAIDPANPDRVYVGTGEGDTDSLFAFRVVNALPAYRGIGPVRSDDGGVNWVNEPSSPSLAGYSFFQIAVDPGNPEHCVAATTNGLYERVAAGGTFKWRRRRTGVHTSVVVCRAAGVTTWFAASQGGRVYHSSTGSTWAAAGTGFPTGVGRIALGVQVDNPNVLYAFITDPAGGLHSVRRLAGGTGAWKDIAGVPEVLPGGQGTYDLCIAVDPNNANRIYLGGDYFNSGLYPGSIWRCDVVTAPTLSMTATSIGEKAHADVHVLAHVPGSSARLYVGTDGGLFEHTNATGAGGFASRNTGLGALCTNFIAQHPTEPAVLYVGLQDNGTAKCVGEEVWQHVLYADGGYCVVNWHDPFQVLVYANGSVYRATDGGLDYDSWTDVTPAGAGWELMAEPLVTTPFKPARPAEADIVALGVGSIVHISSDFGTTWPDQVALPLAAGSAFSMVFASATRIFVGTTIGRVYRLDEAGGTWTATRIDNAPGGALTLAGLVSDIAVDPSDSAQGSIYLTYGGVGDFRHVWHFDGAAWAPRSGTAGSGTELLDVEHNAIQVDRVTNRVYVGADIGVWESDDAGLTWRPLQNGLPDAPVFDIQIHPTARLLRASLHGRGVFEWKLDAPVLPDVELYVRDTMLDTGRGGNTDGRPDPSVAPTAPVVHYDSPNIKVDAPTKRGYQTASTAIDFLTFNHVIVDGSNGVETAAAPPTVHNRVYVEVHNRGRVDATDVRVMAAITNASTGLTLPSGYAANVVGGTPLSGTKWTTLGFVTIPEVHAGFPRIAAFDLPSTALPLPASLPGNSHYCMVVFLHSQQDPFTGTLRNVDQLTLADRKVGQKNLHIVEFVGKTPTPGTGVGTWLMLLVGGGVGSTPRLVDLVVDATRFPGTLHLVVPPALFPNDVAAQADGFAVRSDALVRRWIDQHTLDADRIFHDANYPAAQHDLMVAAMSQVSDQVPLKMTGGRVGGLRGLSVRPKDIHAVFVRVDPPKNTPVGTTFSFDIDELDAGTGRRLGGGRYLVQINEPAP